MQYYNIKYITRASKSSLICRALLKYGYSSFHLDILEYCDPSVIIKREQYYIDTLKPEYNILKEDCSIFSCKQTIESLRIMAEIGSNRSGGSVAKVTEAELERTYNQREDSKKKIRKRKLGREHSEEKKVKLKKKKFF